MNYAKVIPGNQNTHKGFEHNFKSLSLWITAVFGQAVLLWVLYDISDKIITNELIISGLFTTAILISGLKKLVPVTEQDKTNSSFSPVKSGCHFLYRNHFSVINLLMVVFLGYCIYKNGINTISPSHIWNNYKNQQSQIIFNDLNKHISPKVEEKQ